MSGEEVNNSHLTRVINGEVAWRECLGEGGKVNHTQNVQRIIWQNILVTISNRYCSKYDNISYYPQAVLFPCQQTHTQRIVDPDWLKGNGIALLQNSHTRARLRTTAAVGSWKEEGNEWHWTHKNCTRNRRTRDDWWRIQPPGRVVVAIKYMPDNRAYWSLNPDEPVEDFSPYTLC